MLLPGARHLSGIGASGEVADGMKKDYQIFPSIPNYDVDITGHVFHS